jgi:hypothetical protein
MRFLGDAPLAEGKWGQLLEELNAKSGTGGFSNAVGTHGNPRERLGVFKGGFASDLHTCLAPGRGATQPDVATSARPAATIHWYVDKTADAYDVAVAQKKPLILVSGDANGMYFRRLKNEVLFSPALATLASVAIFAYADPTRDVVAKNMGTALGYDVGPTISLLSPNPDMIDEVSRIVGLWDAETVVRQLSKHLRARGWLSSPQPWLPPK